MLNKEQILNMVKLQDKMNCVVNQDWRIAQYHWLLAGGMELMEAIDHHGWKWWKSSQINLPMLQNELVDYWHFLLSECMVHVDGDQIYDLIMSDVAEPSDVVIFDNQGYVLAEMGTVQKLFLLVGLCVSKKFNLHLFKSIMKDCDLTWNELYTQYVGKNILNIFRQDNGYKVGTYYKSWFDGREDNCHMLDAIDRHKNVAHESDFPDVILIELKSGYKKTVDHFKVVSTNESGQF